MTVANFQVYQDSQTALSVTNAFRVLYIGFKKVLGASTFIALVAIAIPLVRLLFWVLIRNLKNNYHPSGIQLTTENYARYYRSYQALGVEIDKLRGVVDYDMKKAPWLLRGILKDIKKLTSLTVNYYNDLSNALDSKDSKSQKAGNLFNRVPSSDLWNNRAKAYSYKL